VIRRRLFITGIVQAVGFRPFVWRQATREGLAGFVENTPAGLLAEVQGPGSAVDAFMDAVRRDPPPLAVVERIVTEELPPVPAESALPFRILESTAGLGPRTLLPADIATCEACLAELGDPADRRHGHPFITCTDCGPRFTIIHALPYDRRATTMRAFGMCPRCAAEYADPASRRFHAETTACPECGPRAWFAAALNPVPADLPPGPGGDASAIGSARRHLLAGGILAVKGLGGFHLACDATRDAAVALLRERKQRPVKPLAVLATDIAAVRTFALVDEQEARLLSGPERPIVLVRKRPAGVPGRGAGGILADAVAPGTEFLGVMLPASPLEHLLAAGLPPLVMTSGNLAEEPMAIDNADAVRRLGTIASGFLLHDRDILVSCDDSVVRCVAGAALPIRRSRGHAPLPVRLAAGGPTILAVGADLKVVVCLAVGERALLGAHVGDTGGLETLAAVERAAEHHLRLFAARPDAIAADLHPGSLSASWAGRFAAARGIPLLRVQHHEAHVAALLGEHFGAAATDAACLVACFDGTGYRADGTIAGGEFFVAAGRRIDRVGHLAPFLLPGGDAAIRHPWRTALAVLRAAGLPWDERLPVPADPQQRRVVDRQLDAGLACPPTTSMGRLFDAVAVLVGGPSRITFEAEAALWLESQAARHGDQPAGRYEFELAFDPATGLLVADWRPVVEAVVGDLRAGVSIPALAAGFHRAVARLVVAARERLAPQAAAVGLTGGVFQNAVLVTHTVAGLRAAGQEPLLPHLVPPNDGGLALGQALLARDLLDHPGPDGIRGRSWADR